MHKIFQPIRGFVYVFGRLWDSQSQIELNFVGKYSPRRKNHEVYIPTFIFIYKSHNLGVI